jgi:hypothetical protein
MVTTKEQVGSEQVTPFCVYKLMLPKTEPKFWVRITGLLASRREAETYIKKKIRRSRYAMFAHNGKTPLPFKIFEADPESEQLIKL